MILAADGAADFIKSLGVVPDTTVGDLDSITISTKAIQNDLIFEPNQDLSDCDKLLNLAAERGHSDITLVCVEGDLLDHVLGSLYSAARSPLNVKLALRRGIAHILRGPVEMHLKLPPSTRLSLMPLTPCKGVSLGGTKWPLSCAELSPLGLTSLSNQTSGPVQVSLEAGTAVLFLAHPDLEAPSWDS